MARFTGKVAIFGGASRGAGASIERATIVVDYASSADERSVDETSPAGGRITCL